MKVSKKKAKEIILKAEKILILISGFVTPDGDSIGSSFGLKMILNKYYRKRVDIKSSFKIPQRFDFLQGINNCKVEDATGIDFLNYDLIIVCDAASPILLIDQSVHKDFSFHKDITTLSIDHHKTNKFWATYNFNDVKASATGEIIAELFNKELTGNKNAAESILTAIITDTGHFRWHLSKKTFLITNNLINCGADIENISQNLYYRDSQYTIELIKRGIERLRWNKTHKFTYTYLSYSDLRKIGGGVDNFRSAVDTVINQYAISQESSMLGITFLEIEKGIIKVEFRGKKASKVDLSEVAKYFGGGGHKYASGFTIYGEMEKVIKKVLNYVDRYI